MQAPDAAAVADWRYDPPYDFYDFRKEPEDLVEILAPANWVDYYYSAFDEAGELAGFFSFKRHPPASIEIGLGLRPALAGKGLGLSFVEAGMDFARRRYSPAELFLDVATFNDRARKIYEKAGFEAERVWHHETAQGTVEFLRMRRSA